MSYISRYISLILTGLIVLILPNFKQVEQSEVVIKEFKRTGQHFFQYNDQLRVLVSKLSEAECQQYFKTTDLLKTVSPVQVVIENMGKRIWTFSPNDFELPSVSVAEVRRIIRRSMLKKWGIRLASGGALSFISSPITHFLKGIFSHEPTRTFGLKDMARATGLTFPLFAIGDSLKMVASNYRFDKKLKKWTIDPVGTLMPFEQKSLVLFASRDEFTPNFTIRLHRKDIGISIPFRVHL